MTHEAEGVETHFHLRNFVLKPHTKDLTYLSQSGVDTRVFFQSRQDKLYLLDDSGHGSQKRKVTI